PGGAHTCGRAQACRPDAIGYPRGGREGLPMAGIPAAWRVVALLLALGLGAACRAPAAEAPRAGVPPPAGAAAVPADATPPPAAVQKVDVCTPGVSQGFAGIAIAQQVGYFAEQGLD